MPTCLAVFLRFLTASAMARHPDMAPIAEVRLRKMAVAQGIHLLVAYNVWQCRHHLRAPGTSHGGDAGLKHGTRRDTCARWLWPVVRGFHRTNELRAFARSERDARFHGDNL